MSRFGIGGVVHLDAVVLERSQVREALVAGVALVGHDVVLLPAMPQQVVQQRVARLAQVALVLVLALVASHVDLEGVLCDKGLLTQLTPEKHSLRVVHLHVLEQYELLGEPLATLLAHERLVVGMGGNVLFEVAFAVGAPTADLAALGA